MRLVRDDGEEVDEVADEDAPDEIVLLQCKHCGKTTWAESISCEHCGYFIRLEDRSGWHPWWWIVGVIAGLLCVIRWIVH